MIGIKIKGIVITNEEVNKYHKEMVDYLAEDEPNEDGSVTEFTKEHAELYLVSEAIYNQSNQREDTSGIQVIRSK